MRISLGLLCSADLVCVFRAKKRKAVVIVSDNFGLDWIFLVEVE